MSWWGLAPSLRSARAPAPLTPSHPLLPPSPPLSHSVGLLYLNGLGTNLSWLALVAANLARSQVYDFLLFKLPPFVQRWVLGPLYRLCGWDASRPASALARRFLGLFCLASRWLDGPHVLHPRVFALADAVISFSVGPLREWQAQRARARDLSPLFTPPGYSRAPPSPPRARAVGIVDAVTRMVLGTVWGLLKSACALCSRAHGATTSPHCPPHLPSRALLSPQSPSCTRR